MNLGLFTLDKTMRSYLYLYYIQLVKGPIKDLVCGGLGSSSSGSGGHRLASTRRGRTRAAVTRRGICRHCCQQNLIKNYCNKILFTKSVTDWCVGSYKSENYSMVQVTLAFWLSMFNSTTTESISFNEHSMKSPLYLGPEYAQVGIPRPVVQRFCSCGVKHA